jgi:hypothetical protein
MSKNRFILPLTDRVMMEKFEDELPPLNSKGLHSLDFSVKYKIINV